MQFAWCTGTQHHLQHFSDCVSSACLQQQLVPTFSSIPTAVQACSRSFAWLLAQAAFVSHQKDLYAENAAQFGCPPEALNGCCAVARGEWKHCSTAMMCWPWLTGQMASCWRLLLWMARSTCGTLRKLSSWYVLWLTAHTPLERKEKTTPFSINE